MTHTPWPLHRLFARTPEQRVAQARERFFEDGVRPTGLVDEAVVQSWLRCAGQGRTRSERLAIDPVSRLRVDTALRRSRLLLQAASGSLRDLERALAATDCTLLLVDPQGTLVYTSSRSTAGRDGLTPSLARLGVDVSERALGTSAPGIVLATGNACTIEAGEHFFEQVQGLRCAAAPIRDIHGRIAGVLDLTVEQRAFGFDPGVLVSLHAAAMQRALMTEQSSQLTLLELHMQPHAPGAGMSGLMGLDEAGQVVWLDTFAERLCGALGRVAGDLPACEVVLGVSLAQLQQYGPGEAPRPLILPNGLSVGLRVRLPLAHTARHATQTEGETMLAAAPAAAASLPPASPRLADHERALIAQTLQECDGNVSAAARRLGISRGRIYRLLPSFDKSA